MVKKHRTGRRHVAVLLLLSSLLVLDTGAIEAVEKITIGEVEDVILVPLGVTFSARIDTGAAESSLDVCEFSVEGKTVTFTLSDRCGGAGYSLPLIGWRYIRSLKSGERRPVVAMEICLGPRRIRTRVTLTDRSNMEFPLLVGRKTLKKGNFVVDVKRMKIAPPSCPGRKSP